MSDLPLKSHTETWFHNEVKPHEDSLRGYLFKNMRDYADVDDIIQETYRRILTVHEQNPIHSPRGLLFRIAKNAMNDVYRKNTRSKTIAVADFEGLDVIGGEYDPKDVFCRFDELELLKQAIASLPEKCRQVLILRKFHHLSYQQISEKMGISKSTIETHLAKGIEKCLKYFEKKNVI